MISELKEIQPSAAASCARRTMIIVFVGFHPALCIMYDHNVEKAIILENLTIL